MSLKGIYIKIVSNFKKQKNITQKNKKNLYV